ncbi:Putative LOC582807, partial [Caligus rogercresseyi]
MVKCDLFEEISIHFHVENHAKFSPDCSFGVISKSYYNYQKIECVEDMIDMDAKASAKFNVISSKKKGCPPIQWYDWKNILHPYFRLIKGMKKFHVLL